MNGFASKTCPALVLVLGAACAESAEPAPRVSAAPPGAPNILLVSIDSLRPDHLGCYGYGKPTSPFIDSLAAEGLLFENALSTTSWTLPAHAALFTGLRDSVHGLVDNGRSLNAEHSTLAEVLSAGGYRTAGFYGGPYLHPVFGVGQGFETYVNCMSQSELGEEVRQEAMLPDSRSHTDVTGPRTRQAVARWAAATVEDARPYFLFVHLWDVHYDYTAPEEYVRMFDEGYVGEVDGRLMSNPAIHGEMSERDLEHLLALYDAEIRFTDDVLRGLLQDLGALGMLENTLVVLTSDHGEEFFEHRQKGHNKSLYDEVLRVPLILHWPGEIPAGARTQLQVQLIDLMPTLIATTKVAALGSVQGRDLSPLFAGASLPEREALAELLIDGQSYRALRSNARKVIEVQRGEPAFFADLKAHPREDVWIQKGGPHDAKSEEQRLRAQAELRAAIERCLEFGGALEAGELSLDEDTAQRLRELGYLGSDED